MVTVKVKKEYFSIVLIILLVFLLFKFPDAIKSGITEGLSICFQTVIPSLFPFLVLSSYVVNSNILNPFYRFLSPVTRVLFKQPANAVPVIILSMIGGFPVGLKMIKELFKREEITEIQAKRLCLFCMNSGPAFTITVVGANLLRSTLAGVVIYSSLCISSLIIGFFTRFIFRDDGRNCPVKQYRITDLSTLSASVTSGINNILGICGWIVLFSGFIECFNILNSNYFLSIFVKTTVEVTRACIEFSGKIALPYLAFIIGFGGFCVHFQILDCLKKCKMNYSHFLFSRVMNGCLSAIITYIILIFVPVEIDVFATSNDIQPASFSVSIWGFIALIIMCIIMIFDIDRKKKVC